MDKKKLKKVCRKYGIKWKKFKKVLKKMNEEVNWKCRFKGVNYDE